MSFSRPCRKLLALSQIPLTGHFAAVERGKRRKGGEMKGRKGTEGMRGTLPEMNFWLRPNCVCKCVLGLYNLCGHARGPFTFVVLAAGKTCCDSFQHSGFVIQAIIVTGLISNAVRSGVVAQSVERRTCDQEIEGSTPGQRPLCLDKLFTPLCLCRQTIKW